MKRTFLTVLLIALVAIAAVVLLWWKRQPAPNEAAPSEEVVSAEIIARELDVPWSLAFLPSGELLVTERSGTVRVVGEQERTLSVPEVAEVGEGGLLGIALHPDFASNKFLYLYYTIRPRSEIMNRVVRYVFDGDALTEPKVIVDAIPGGTIHNGGRIAFGPDGFLYITTGDTGKGDLAQDTASLAGKILRVGGDGSIPQDNPFRSAVYSYGHRNPQGIAWDSSGRLWETEHGRSGVRSGFDEVNRIEKGANYGWPLIEGSETRAGMRTPVIHSGPSTTWAPSGIAIKDDTLYFAGLRGKALYSAPIRSDGTLGEVRVYLNDAYGRLRAAAIGPEGSIYLTTSNRDGRGAVRAGDDRVVRLSL